MLTRLVARAGYGISQFMEGTGANLRLPLNPPFFFESAVNYDVTTGAGNAASGFAGLVAGTTPTGNVRAYDPDLRPQFSQQWNTFVEYQVSSSMSAQSATSAITRSSGHTVRRQQLSGRRRSRDLGGQEPRRRAFVAQPPLRPLPLPRPRWQPPPAMQASLVTQSHGVDLLAS